MGEALRAKAIAVGIASITKAKVVALYEARRRNI